MSGAPWLKPGDKKMLPFSALTTNALCKRHNSLLSPIDTVGAALFEAIQKCGTTDIGPGQLFLLSGHDVERWMLRSLAIFGVSGNFALDGAVIDQNFVDRLRIVELLEDPKQWKKPLGFYLTRGLGHQFWRRDNIQIAPVVKTGGDEIMGITLDLQGLEFALLAADHDVTGTGLGGQICLPWRGLRHLLIDFRRSISLSMKQQTNTETPPSNIVALPLHPKKKKIWPRTSGRQK